ncbi:ATP-binding cassette domain-containing protein [Arthrobacter sp. UC242_113]|uniref:ATP-binding cassette domain-containing protein n=1 Tax=Arthrobacter sp. UC242_113 TaxID=3374550 RepID=UPI003758221A
MQEATGLRTPTLTLRGISKNYADVQVLTNIDLDVHAGEAVGLLGQNGAGKSTLIKIISGVEKPSQGLISLDGAPADFRSTHEAQNAGIATIHQEIILVPQMSVAENLCLSDLPRKGTVLDRRALYQEASRAIKALGFDLDVRAPANQLTAAQKQVVLIAKALRQKAKILLLDEPTATLPAPDVTKLFELLRKLKQEGTGIIYISHRIDEMYENLRPHHGSARRQAGDDREDCLPASSGGRAEDARDGPGRRPPARRGTGTCVSARTFEEVELCESGARTLPGGRSPRI